MTPQTSSLMDTVEEMLLDAGQEQDTGLRAALLSLGSLASLPAPAPNAELAALLGSRPGEMSWRRRLRRHRPTIVGLAVVAGMGLGVTGVAASASGPAGKASSSVQHLLEDWTPSWSVSGLPSAAPMIRLLPESVPADPGAASDSGTAAGQQGAPAHQPTRPHDFPAGAANAGSDDGGADARDAAGSAGRGVEAAGREPADSVPKVPSDPEPLPDNAQDAARHAVEKAQKLLSGVVPDNAVSEGNGSAGKSGANNKADPGAKWLKKFNH